MQRISTDSDADASPKKNAADINDIAMAVEFVVKALEEMAKQHAVIKLKIAKLAGEDLGMEAPASIEVPDGTPASVPSASPVV